MKRTTAAPPVTRLALLLGFGVLATVFTGHAGAACGQYNPTDPSLPPAWDAPLPTTSAMMRAVYRTGDVRIIHVRDDDRDSGGAAGIVGTWRFTFVSDGTAYPVQIPYGAVVDFGTVQWHSDGTEFMISGGRPPSSGDVCMGSWQRTGPSTYVLKHIALAWASSDSMPPASPAAYIGPAIISEVVTLNHARDRFEGSFTLDQYAKDEVTLLEHIGGTITATRFNAQ
ncbi:MAG TPA: hypothetical protein VH041_08845 [Caldimonas sp.]|nr:hypothetical protein [Caldimonas sp.]HEX4234403.1 hypothetical protein [Caldimonas sp.]